MKLIAGLGNPGREYAHTRHNVGFDVIDLFSHRHKTRVGSRRCRALVGLLDFEGREIVLAKPQTYMNLSGDAVALVMRQYQVQPSEMLVIYDDMDLPLGKLRIRPLGSAGGHNGMKSIIGRIGSTDFPRMRIGIGRDTDAIGHVLSRFDRAERKIIDDTIDRAASAVEVILSDGLEQAMNMFNRDEGG